MGRIQKENVNKTVGIVHFSVLYDTNCLLKNNSWMLGEFDMEKGHDSTDLQDG